MNYKHIHSHSHTFHNSIKEEGRKKDFFFFTNQFELIIENKPKENKTEKGN